MLLIKGKGTGERSLVRQLLKRVVRRGLLFLLDAGLYSFEILWNIDQAGQKFIVRAPRNLKLKPIKHLPDGSFLARLTHKVEDHDAPPTKSGRKRWKKVSLIVRAIRIDPLR